MPKTRDVGVIVGRFQVHRLHDAHLNLIKQVYDTHRHTIIVLGLSQSRVTASNPLDFESRKQMMLAVFPKATILYIKDEPDDRAWSLRLDAIVDAISSPAQTVEFYGGRDSFIARYEGRHPTTVLEPEIYAASGTELRKTISKGVKASEDFRAGVIWAASNGYPKVFPTVDVAIWRQEPCTGMPGDRKPKEWLLVRKPNEKQWRFCGGFVSPTDASLEAAARREVQEETGVALADIKYVWSGLVDDWRYREEADKIMTTLFAAQYLSGPVKPADDVAEAQWFTLRPERGAVIRIDLVPEHGALLEALTGEL